MRTFSEIVDSIIASVGQPALLHMTCVEVNAVINDLRTNHPSDFDLGEVRLQRGVSSNFQWRIPHDFRAMRVARFDGNIFVSEAKPGIVQKKLRRYWYQSGDAIVFIGARHIIDVAYYRSRQVFKYVKSDQRLLRSSAAAEYDYDFRPAPDAPWVPMLQVNQQNSRSYNAHVDWVVRQYPEAIFQGAISAIYNHLGQLEKGARAYQSFTRSKDIINRSRGLHTDAEI